MKRIWIVKLVPKWRKEINRLFRNLDDHNKQLLILHVQVDKIFCAAVGRRIVACRRITTVGITKLRRIINSIVGNWKLFSSPCFITAPMHSIWISTFFNKGKNILASAQARSNSMVTLAGYLITNSWGNSSFWNNPEWERWSMRSVVERARSVLICVIYRKILFLIQRRRNSR